MNHIIWYIIIILFVIILFILMKRKNEGFENIDINIGNVLSIYYYEYFISLLKKEHLDRKSVV
jgi:hypothetical protein